MGFGWLLCGYFAMFMMSFGMGQYAFAATLIGGFIAYQGAVRLRDYCPSFGATAMAAIGMMVVSIHGLLRFVDDTFSLGWPFLTTTVSTVVSYVEFAVGMIFHFCMLYSILELSKEVGVAKIYTKISGYMSLFGVCAVAQVVLWMFPSLANVENQMPVKILVLLLLVGYLMTSWLLYRCYQYICPEGEEYGKERKPSRFAFINRWREKSDARDEQMFRDAQNMMKNRMEKRQNKQSRRKKK
jgi:glucan phosphoethanolaminetransferase (alkaline phosphatase superfamily)